MGGRSRSTTRRLHGLERKLDGMQAPDLPGAPAFAEYRHEPVRFAQEVLGVESATRRSDGSPYQWHILEAVRDHERVAIRSGHGTGKTTSLGILALWWLLTRPDSKVVVVAPQFARQVRGVVFAAIRQLARRARTALPVELQAGRVVVEGFGEEWAVLGMPATEPDRIEGIHAEGGVLLLMDETKGIGQDVYDALQGALTGGDDSRLVVASTPGAPQGPFFRACNDGEGWWKQIHLSSEDSSRVNPKWVEGRAREWGVESALYQMRVRGEFADAGEGQLFSFALVEKAQAADVAPGETTLGVDVARSIAGDVNAVCVARGGRVERFTLWRSPDLMVTVGRVIHEAGQVLPKGILVDAGGVGAGVADRLKQLRFAVEAVQFGGGASDPQRFRNRRAELYWGLRELLEQGKVSLPEDDELVADLTSVRYRFTQDGRVELEPKEELRKKLGRSPDRADALVLAVARLAQPKPVAAVLNGHFTMGGGHTSDRPGMWLGDIRMRS
jgi:phage terminase large subunit